MNETIIDLENYGDVEEMIRNQSFPGFNLMSHKPINTNHTDYEIVLKSYETGKFYKGVYWHGYNDHIAMKNTTLTEVFPKQITIYE